MSRKLIIISITSLIIISDFLTKQAVVNNLFPYEMIDVLPFLRIVYVENKGAAFGLFANLGNQIFMAVSVIAIIAIGIYIFLVKKTIEVFSLSLILGGATGNFIDRVRIGKVIDFIDIFVGKWHWPAFNIADSALTIGIIIFLWSNLLRGTKNDLESHRHLL